MRIRPNLLLTLFAVSAISVSSATARAELIVGLIRVTDQSIALSNNLVRFDSSSPGTVSPLVLISGLATASEFVVGIDFRPADGSLIAVSRELGGTNDGRGRIYSVNPFTGVATLISGNNGLRDASNNEVLLSEPDSFGYGVDFNPVSNALRIVNSADQNLRITLGGSGVTFVDTPLNGPGTGADPIVNAIAYNNNVAGASQTTLYALNRIVAEGTTRLQTIGGLNGTPSPNTGQLLDVAPLTPNSVNVFANSLGFDISGASGVAYATLKMTPPNDTPRLYSIDLATGATTLLGAYGGPGLLIDITVVPEPGSLTLMAFGAAGLAGLVVRRSKGW